MEITFITSNHAKAKYLSNFFKLPVEHRKLDLPEIQSLNLREIVEDKARRAFEAVKKPVLVEDVSLIFNALDKLPGPLIKWFLHTLGNEGLCRLLDGYKDRSAVAEVQFGFCDQNGVKVFSGAMKGSIASGPRGSTNFGWDPIFIPEGFTKTRGEMTEEEKHFVSMRRPALQELAEWLAKCHCEEAPTSLPLVCRPPADEAGRGR